MSLENAQRNPDREPPSITRFLSLGRDYLRRSVAADANESEARLRLLHVLLELNDLTDASRVLAEHDWAPDGAAFEYLARLFEGDLHERRGTGRRGRGLRPGGRARRHATSGSHRGGSSRTPRWTAIGGRGDRDGGARDLLRKVRPLVAVPPWTGVAVRGLPQDRALAGHQMRPLVLLLLMSAVLAAAPGPQDSAQAPRFKTRVAAVRVDALVTNGRRPVTGLTAANFELRDNGVVQTITDVHHETLPLNIICALDSAAASPGEPLEHLKQGVRGVIAALAGDGPRRTPDVCRSHRAPHGSHRRSRAPARARRRCRDRRHHVALRRGLRGARAARDRRGPHAASPLQRWPRHVQLADRAQARSTPPAAQTW